VAWKAESKKAILTALGSSLVTARTMVREAELCLLARLVGGEEYHISSSASIKFAAANLTYMQQEKLVQTVK
jgi:hypothetical protein